MPKRSFFCLSLSTLAFIAASLGALEAGPAEAAPLVRVLAPGLLVEVDPRLELLAAAQAWTTWTRPGFPGVQDSARPAYAADLAAWVEPWKDEEAVTLLDQLQKGGFSYDAPPNFVLSTEGGLTFRIPAQGFSKYLVNRAGGLARLESLARVLALLAVRSNFIGFFNGRRAYYEALVGYATRGLDAPALAGWLKSFYGDPGDTVFHFVLAPALMPAGGYAATVDRTEDGRPLRHVYQVIRQAEKTTGAALASLSLHEFGHSFVNPAIGDQIPADLRPGLEALFFPVWGQMRAQAYGTLETFLDELVLRAATLRGRVQLGLLPEANLDKALRAEESWGFTSIRAIYEALEVYEAHRDRWPRFQDFGPDLLAWLASRKPAGLP